MIADVTLPVNYDISASGTIAVAKVNEYVTAAGTGSVTAAVSDTAANAKDLATVETDLITVTITNDAEATLAADLNAINGKTAVAVNASAVTAISGSASDWATLEAAATLGTPTITLKSDAAVEVTDAADVALINDLAALTDGVVIATASSNAFADFATLNTAGTDKITIELTDARLDAADIFTTVNDVESGLVTKTAELVDLTGVAEITGSIAELKILIGKAKALSEGGEVSLNTAALKLTVTSGTLEDGLQTATALDIKLLADFTDGLVDATIIDVVKGSAITQLVCARIEHFHLHNVFKIKMV